MNKLLIGALAFLTLTVGFSLSGNEAHADLSEALSGRILLDVERNGEAWYVYPDTGSRYYLGRPDDAFRLMRELGLGITDADLAQIPVAGDPREGDLSIRQRAAGQIVLQVEANGEAWYVHPVDMRRSYLGRPADAFDLMTAVGLGVTSVQIDSMQAVPPPNFKVAFLGDQDVKASSRAVLDILVEENVDVVVHPGDLGYKKGPQQWNSMIRDYFGDTFPYLATVGNHDLERDEWPIYEVDIQNRQTDVPGLYCSGEVGVNQRCTYHGMTFVLSGVGTFGEGHEEYLDASLASSTAKWDVCAWHKNQRLMQVGGKEDKVGWEAYDICREHGAIVATAHEHSYSRTHLLSDFENQTIENTGNTLVLQPGKSFAFVSGLAGQSIRDQQDELALNPWWASVYTASQDANYGALICTFTAGGDESRADCEFEDIDGNVPDTFSLRQLGQ